jgi:histidinol-phosphate aminotransferase
MSYARNVIAQIAGYVPGEQPVGKTLIKLNTNENPYPPATKIADILHGFPYEKLRLYSEPSAQMVRDAASEVFNISADRVICGNGSDDLLTIALRTFVDQGKQLAYTEPSYSLYPVLADLQGAQRLPIALDENFDLPDNAAELAKDAQLFMLARPNAPTGNNFAMAKVEKLCREFKGVVWIDEAYADFAEDNCLPLLEKYPNVVVSRTLSKSYSLAGLRLGIAFASKELIFEMNKVKDSYNIDMISQFIGAAAIQEQEYMKQNAEKIKATRAKLTEKLQELNCTVLPSQANFLFVKTPKAAEDVFTALREKGFLVRYFKLPRVSEYIRISIGLPEEMEAFTKCIAEILA